VDRGTAARRLEDWALDYDFTYDETWDQVAETEQVRFNIAEALRCLDADRMFGWPDVARATYHVQCLQQIMHTPAAIAERERVYKWNASPSQDPE